MLLISIDIDILSKLRKIIMKLIQPKLGLIFLHKNRFLIIIITKPKVQ